MAAKKKATAAEPAKTTAVVKWDEEMAKQAAIAAGMEEGSAGGRFFSAQSGVLSWNDMPIPNNQMAVVILDSILENVFYEGEFDAKTPQGPLCFAFGRSEKEMTPHKIIVENGTAQSDMCSNCQFNEWGSADKGRGKACRNTRRLAMIPAGELTAEGKFTIFEELSSFEDSAIGHMKLPVTSVKGYASFVKQLSGVLKRPPYGVITKVRVVTDPKSVFRIIFDPLEKVGEDLLPVIFKRHEEAAVGIDFPYTPMDEEVKPKVKAKAEKQTRSRIPVRGKKKY